MWQAGRGAPAGVTWRRSQPGRLVQRDRLGLAVSRGEHAAPRGRGSGPHPRARSSGPPDAVTTPRRVDPEAPDLADSLADRTDARRRRPEIRLASDPGHEEGAAGRVEHGGGQPELPVVEAAVARDELRLGLGDDPARPRRAVGLGAQRARRKRMDPYPLSFPRRRVHSFPWRRPSHPFRVLTRPPRHRLRRPRTGRTGPLGHPPRLRAVDGAAGGGAAVGLLRGPADRQRHARSPPRLGPGLQGPLLPLPHDGRLVRGPPCRLGHPRAARSRSRWRRSSGSPASSRSRSRSASPSSPACAVSRSTPTSTSSSG